MVEFNQQGQQVERQTNIGEVKGDLHIHLAEKKPDKALYQKGDFHQKSIYFFDRKHLVEKVQSGLAASVFLPIVVFGEEEHWHDGVGQRLLYESRKESIRHPKQYCLLGWEYEGSDTDRIEALHKKLYQFFVVSEKLVSLTDTWKREVATQLQELLSDKDSRLVVQYTLRQDRSSKKDLSVITSLLRDWEEIQSYAMSGRFLIVFSFVLQNNNKGGGFLSRIKSSFASNLTPKQVLEKVGLIAEEGDTDENNDGIIDDSCISGELEKIHRDDLEHLTMCLSERFEVSQDSCESLRQEIDEIFGKEQSIYYVRLKRKLTKLPSFVDLNRNT